MCENEFKDSRTRWILILTSAIRMVWVWERIEAALNDRQTITDEVLMAKIAQS